MEAKGTNEDPSDPAGKGEKDANTECCASNPNEHSRSTPDVDEDPSETIPRSHNMDTMHG